MFYLRKAGKQFYNIAAKHMLTDRQEVNFDCCPLYYLSSHETSYSVGGAKTKKKTPGTPASRTWFVSNVWFCGARIKTRHSGKMIEWLIGALNYSTTGGA